MTAVLCVACALLGQAPAELRFAKVDGGTQVVASLPAALQAKLPEGKLTQDQGEEWLRVCLVDAKTGKAGPPMFGAYQRRGGDLIFRPRFAPEPGQLYRAHFGPDDRGAGADYRMPSLAPAAAAHVVKVYPTGDVLPANLLKFYIYFSQPMRGGQAMFKQFAILDEGGKEVYDPWLHDEIWDEEACCLILYIHPGRIKWGILLRELLGPVLVADRRYTLVVRGAILDAEGRPMGKDFSKAFRTTAEDRVRVNIADWQITAPSAGTREPLLLKLSKSFDHRSLGRFLSIADASGQPVRGKFEVGATEKQCSFVPAEPWSNQEHRLTVDTRCEDVAGNTPLRPFDADTKVVLPAPRCELTFRPSVAKSR